MKSLRLPNITFYYYYYYYYYYRGAISPVVKRTGSEADHSPPSNNKFKNGGAVPPLPHFSMV
jgi:hypothetical protein